MTHNPKFLYSLCRSANTSLRNSFTLPKKTKNQSNLWYFHQRSTTVSLETYPSPPFIQADLLERNWTRHFQDFKYSVLNLLFPAGNKVFDRPKLTKQHWSLSTEVLGMMGKSKQYPKILQRFTSSVTVNIYCLSRHTDRVHDSVIGNAFRNIVHEQFVGKLLLFSQP